MLTRMLFSFLLIFLPLTLASPTDGNSTKIFCHHVPRTNLGVTDCAQLVDRLSNPTWFSNPVTYGPMQSPPGSTPIRINYQSCQFQLRGGSGRGADNQTIRLSDYTGDLLEVIDQCMDKGKSRKKRFNAGILTLGSKNKFYALLSGIRTPRDKGNETVAEPDDADTRRPGTAITLT